MIRHEVLASGTSTGIAGGAAMLAVAMLGAASQDLPALLPLHAIGESLVGADAFESAAAKAGFGASVHAAISVAIGVLLAAVLPRDFPTASALGAAVGLSLFVLMIMMSLVVPWASPGFRSAMQDVGGTWVLAHAVFGAAAGTSPALRRRLARGRADVPAGARARRPAPVAPETRTT